MGSVKLEIWGEVKGLLQNSDVIKDIIRIDDGLPRWHSGKESACQCRRYKRCGFDPRVRKIPWSRKWQPAPVFLPGKFHEQRRLVGYSPWIHKESMAVHISHGSFTFPYK